MVSRQPFYEPYKFTIISSLACVSKVRRSLIKCLNVDQSNESFGLDVKIQINNPRLSSQNRHIGSLRAAKHYSSSKGPKPTYASAKKTVPSGQNVSLISSPQLVRLSVSQKKLQHHAQVVGLGLSQSTRKRSHNFALLAEMSVPPTIDELQNFDEVKKKDDLQERREKMKKAAQYLIREGNILKELLRGPHTSSPTMKCTDNTAVLNCKFSLLDEEAKDCGCKPESPLKVPKARPKFSSNCLTFCYQTHSEAKVEEKKEPLLSVCRASSWSIKTIEESQHPTKSPVKIREPPKKLKQRRFTDTSLVSELSFAAKMEQLAFDHVMK